MCALVHLEEDLGEDRVEVEPLACACEGQPGVCCTPTAGIVSKSAEGLAKMMPVIVTVFEAAGLTVFEKKTETMLLPTLNQVLPTSPLIVEAAGQRYMQMTQVLCLGGLIDANADIMPRRSNDGSDSRGHATTVSSASCTIWRMPLSW